MGCGDRTTTTSPKSVFFFVAGYASIHKWNSLFTFSYLNFKSFFCGGDGSGFHQNLKMSSRDSLGNSGVMVFSRFGRHRAKSFASSMPNHSRHPFQKESQLLVGKTLPLPSTKGPVGERSGGNFPWIPPFTSLPPITISFPPYP